MRVRVNMFLAVLLALAVTSPAACVSADNATSARRPYDHVFVIVEENTEFSDVIGNTAEFPTLNALAGQYGLATNYFGTSHPSEGNYVSLIGGANYEITDDGSYQTHQINQPSIVDQLEQAHLTWKGYFQNLPVPGFTGNCYPNSSACLYASKHDGFLNFTHVSNDPAEKAKLVPDSDLVNDLKSGTVPIFSFIVPDQCHDGHGESECPNSKLLQDSDAYLKSTVDAIMRADFWGRGRNAIVITFDEGTTNLGCCVAGADPMNSGGGRVATIVIRNNQSGPLQDPTPYNHYSLVATVQKALGLGCTFNDVPVGNTCDSESGVVPMDPLFAFAST